MSKDSIDVTKIQKKLTEFSSEREWGQFHTPKNIVMALSVEVAELVEIFQWSKNGGLDDIKDPDIKNNIEDEIADVFNYLLKLVDILDLNLEEISLKKIKKNEIKYPVLKAKGIAKKYTKL